MGKLKIPEFGEFVRNIGKIVTIEELPPELPKRDYIIEEITARIDLLRNNTLLAHLGTFNDFYGYESSIKTAIAEARKYMIQEKIIPKSEVEVRVSRVATQYRARPNWVENFFVKGYTEFSMLEFGSKRDMPEDQEEIVWSSKWNIKVQQSSKK